MNKTTALLLTLTATAYGHSLFDPVPADEMRELSADRPDTTESPITVDAGHVQIEASLFDWSRTGRDDSFTVMSTNFKLGLTDHTDIQFVFDSFVWENNAGPARDAQGFGDVQIRYKWNLWGNDGGDTAFALFPFVKIPTDTDVSNGKWEGGLILPFGMSLRENVGLGVMGEIDIVADDAGGHDFEFLHSAVLGFDLTENLGAFAEYYAILGEHRYEPYLSGGFTYAVTPDHVLDLGFRAGLNGHAEDVGLFTGFTVRY